jgi:hypothetical protein
MRLNPIHLREAMKSFERAGRIWPDNPDLPAVNLADVLLPGELRSTNPIRKTVVGLVRFFGLRVPRLLAARLALYRSQRDLLTRFAIDEGSGICLVVGRQGVLSRLLPD